MNMDKDNIKIEMEENNKHIEHIEHIEPEIIDAIEHVPCCRKCCDEFIRNHDDSEQRCRECCIRNNENNKKCHKKWIECGKIEDEKCIRCCRLNFGALLQSRCPKPCFECCNNFYPGILMMTMAFIVIFTPIILVIFTLFG
jgi:hypothetical protein